VLEDDARRKRKHLGRAATKRAGHGIAGLPRGCEPGRARSAVGVAGINQKCAYRFRSRQVVPAHLHRGRRKGILGEHAGDPGPRPQPHQHQVIAIHLAYARIGEAQVHAGHGQQQIRIRRGEIDGHGDSRASTRSGHEGAALR